MLALMASIDDKRFLLQVGDRIRRRRRELGLKQRQLGERSDLHRAYIGQVERGQRNLTLLNLRRIARALRLNIPDLF